VKSEIKAELLRELTLDLEAPLVDIGIRFSRDPRHPLHRGRPVVSFASWDLLNIATNREISNCFVQAQAEFGSGATSARSIGGTTSAHERAEARISRYFAAESALLFSSRGQAVLTMLTTLCAEGVTVISTPLSTLPVADACSLVGAEFVECETVENLRVVLDKNPLSKRVIIMLESVSSLTGEAVDISAWLSTAAATGAWVIVDESAALGLGGLRGAGSAELAPASPALLARIVGFQYALGIDVAAIVGPIELRELLMKRSRYLKHEPPPAPIFARLAHVSIDVIELALLQREMLAARSLLVDRAIRSQAWIVAGASPSPILSIRLDSLRKAREVQEGMLQRGLLVEALPARSLRRNGAVVRALISNAHSQEEVEAFLTGFAEVRKRLESPVS